MGGRGNGGNWKAALAILAALGIPGAGVAGFYKLQADSEWTCKNLEALRIKHEADINTIEGKFTGLKASLDSIATHGAASEAKLDMLVQMVRDMRGAR